MRPPLVLGLGNLILGDDAVGLELLGALERTGRWSEAVEFVDGGTQGLALLGVLSDRPGVVVLDAIGRGGAPGSVYELDREQALAFEPSGAGTAHEGGAAQLLRLAALTGDLPDRVRVVGVEPETVRTSIGLGDAVTRAFPEALRRAASAVDELVAAAAPVGADVTGPAPPLEAGASGTR